MQSIAEESQQQTQSTGKQVTELQKQLEGIAAQHNARTEELYVKFAAVLNEKKRQAQSLKQSLDDAQATLQVVAACTHSVLRCPSGRAPSKDRVCMSRRPCLTQCEVQQPHTQRGRQT